MPLAPAQTEKLRRYLEGLRQANIHLNLTASESVERLWVRHIEDSLQALPWLEKQEGGRLLDLGSGGGLPGLALAIGAPHWEAQSLDSRKKKVDFQNRMARELDLPRFQATAARMEDLARLEDWREQFDLVTARALAPWPILAEMALPFVRPGGVFLAWKGPGWMEEGQVDEATWQGLGGGKRISHPYTLTLPGEEGGPEETRAFVLVEAVKAGTCVSFYPRSMKKLKRLHHRPGQRET